MVVGRKQRTEMTVAERHAALTSISKRGLTCAQRLEKGSAPSRETAQSVRELVVP